MARFESVGTWFEGRMPTSSRNAARDKLQYEPEHKLQYEPEPGQVAYEAAMAQLQVNPPAVTIRWHLRSAIEHSAWAAAEAAVRAYYCGS